jgi:quercetin dioxygenase-like cupin family protein
LLSGALAEDGGREVAAGDVLVSPAGSAHALTSSGAEPCVCCVVEQRP